MPIAQRSLPALRLAPEEWPHLDRMAEHRRSGEVIGGALLELQKRNASATGEGDDHPLRQPPSKAIKLTAPIDRKINPPMAASKNDGT